jgi:predicted NUDIX family NTP pyrophosphohydrolase
VIAVRLDADVPQDPLHWIRAHNGVRMAKCSAGILLYKRSAGELLVLLAHPGGPFWRKRDVGAWTIPKGEYESGESPEDAARREFREELGTDAIGPLEPLGVVTQKGGKRVIAFALEGDFDVALLRSNTFEFAWPPRSGRVATFPEVDKVEWMTLAMAREKILPSQIPLLDRLVGL